MILADINHHIHTLSTPTQKSTSLSSSATKDLKRCGRDLWNECIKERRKRYDGLAPKERSRLLVRARIFAFQINALAREGSKGKRKDTEADVVYMMTMALTVGRLCIDDSDLDGARLALQKVAEYMEQLKEVPGGDMGLRSRLEAEYLTMRTALVSWPPVKMTYCLRVVSRGKRIASMSPSTCTAKPIRFETTWTLPRPNTWPMLSNISAVT